MAAGELLANGSRFTLCIAPLAWRQLLTSPANEEAQHFPVMSLRVTASANFSVSPSLSLSHSLSLSLPVQKATVRIACVGALCGACNYGERNLGPHCSEARASLFSAGATCCATLKMSAEVPVTLLHGPLHLASCSLLESSALPPQPSQPLPAAQRPALNKEARKFLVPFLLELQAGALPCTLLATLQQLGFQPVATASVESGGWVCLLVRVAGSLICPW